MLANQNHDRSEMCYREAGEWLRKQRRYWAITQSEFAEQVGADDVSVIERIETGHMALPHTMQAAVARTFGLDGGVLADYCDRWYGREYAKAA